MKTLRLFLIPFLVPAFAVMVVSFCLCPAEAKAAPVPHEVSFHSQQSCCCPRATMKQASNMLMKSSGASFDFLKILSMESQTCPEDEHCPIQTTIVEKDHAIGTESFNIEKVSPQAFLELVSRSINFPIKNFSPEILSHSPPLQALQIETAVLRI